MTETIVCALITGGMTLMGVLIANGKQQAITDTKLDELTREVREHNSFAQRVPVTKWSRPSRRMRVVEIVPGVYENWDGGMIAEFSVKQQGNVAATALPYGTCTIKIDNLSRRFEPRSKNGIFQSIEERPGD